MMLGANATVDYLVSRVKAETDFTPTIETFVVNQAKFDSPPTLELTSPVVRSFAFQTDFSVRLGSGLVTAEVVYLPNGGCNIMPGSLTGKIAIWEAVDRPCGYVMNVVFFFLVSLA
jgi:hypothetical protein